MERYADLMWSDDTLTFARYDRKGEQTSKYIETLRAMRDEAEPEDDDAPAEEWTKYEAISAAYVALIREFEAAAKAYCNEARKSEGFKEYEKEHWNDR